MIIAVNFSFYLFYFIFLLLKLKKIESPGYKRLTYPFERGHRMAERIIKYSEEYGEVP